MEGEEKKGACVVRQHNLQLWDMNSTDEAIEFIQSSIGDSTAFVGFSGGKDSIVTAELIRLSGVKYELYYSFTGIDAPEVVQFIRSNYPKCKFLLPKRTFWKNLSSNVPPSDRLRWCCTALKKEASWKLPHKKRVMGIRAEESSRRAKRDRINHFKKLDHTHYYPIFYWEEWQIWEFIERHQLEYPKLYNQGFNRIGCVVCPYHSEATGNLHQLYRKQWPKYFERWEKGISELYEKRKSQGKTMHFPSANKFLENWYLSNNARWYAEEKN